jgi:predicted PurR-regulated permease PerM
MTPRRLTELWPLDRRGTHALLALTAVLFIFWFVVALKAVFTPFFIALILSYIFNPFVNLGEKFRIPRWVSTFFIFLCFSLFFLFMVFVVLPSLRQEFLALTGGGELMKELPMKIGMSLKDLAKQYLSPDILDHAKRYISDWEVAVNSSSDLARSSAITWAKSALFQVAVWSSWFLDFILIPFYMFFLLNSLNRTWKFIENTFIPYDYREIIFRITQKIHISLSAFFRGRLLICLFIGVLAWLGLLFLGVPFSFLLGFGIGFATIVPLFGLVFLVPAVVCYALIGAHIEQQLLLIAFYAFLQGLEMFILSPFILGKEVELPPMALVMSVLICGYLFGGIGVVLAVPIASTAKILFEEFVFPSFVELSKKDTNSPKVIQKKKRV